MVSITPQTSPSVLPHPYSSRQALLMAKCSKIIYSSKGRAERLLEKISFSLKYFSNNEPSFLIAEHDQCIVVAFKGKQKFFDFINILKFLHIETKIKRIHNGFKTMYNKAHYLIWFQLSQLSNTKPIYFTGHSLGGALAVIATAQLEGFHVAGCYTFGAPPIGIKELEYPLQKPVYEVVTDNDPFLNLEGSNYFYIGSLRVLTQDQILYEQQEKPDKQQLKNKIALSLKTFKAHSIQEYINRLESIEDTKRSLSI